jgi:NAD+ kinase
MIRKITLLFNNTKESARIIAEKIDGIITRRNDGGDDDITELSRESIAEDTQLVISVGGDGTLLHTARLLGGRVIPVAHINVGTLGFLGTEVDDLDAYIEKLLKSDFETEDRMLLSASVSSQEGADYRALNDIVIRNGVTARVINLDVSAGGRRVYKIKGDGVIISTPTGSTAYSLAVGGPIVSPELRNMVIAPLNPHSLSMRSVVIGDIEILVHCAEKDAEVIMTVDGQISRKLSPPEKIKINISSQPLKLVKTGESFFDLLSRKLKWG